MTDQTGRSGVRPPTGLHAASLSCRRGARLLFASLTLQLAPGAALRVAGANGSGKTTLLRVLAGLARPEAGSLSWDGAPMHGGDGPGRVAYLGHANALKEDLSALENLRYACMAEQGGMRGDSSAADPARSQLEWIGLGRQAALPVRHLSQGQRRRVALARLRLAGARPLWLVDEPFAALDRAAIVLVCAMLEEQRARGGIVVYTTHDDTRLASELTLDLDAHAGPVC